MSPDEIFAGQMWTWPDPMLKRDPSGRVIVVNASFLRLYGGQASDWTGHPVAGWPEPLTPGQTTRFETRLDQDTDNETIYDWLEITLPDGTALALARDVTKLLASANTSPNTSNVISNNSDNSAAAQSSIPAQQPQHQVDAYAPSATGFQHDTAAHNNVTNDGTGYSQQTRAQSEPKAYEEKAYHEPAQQNAPSVPSSVDAAQSQPSQYVPSGEPIAGPPPMPTMNASLASQAQPPTQPQSPTQPYAPVAQDTSAYAPSATQAPTPPAYGAQGHSPVSAPQVQNSAFPPAPQHSQVNYNHAPETPQHSAQQDAQAVPSHNGYSQSESVESAVNQQAMPPQVDAAPPTQTQPRHAPTNTHQANPNPQRHAAPGYNGLPPLNPPQQADAPQYAQAHPHTRAEPPRLTESQISQEPQREVVRRTLPIEDGDAVLGNNWRDAVIAKAVGVEDISAAKSSQEEPEAESQVSEPVSDMAGRKILLAEDNAINALLTRTLLEAEGCTVDVVEDGALAVEAVRSASYDMIFMDMRMPNMDGLEATRKIRAMGLNADALPIVALTANAFDDDRNACFDSGMNDFMTKPVAAEELSEMVRMHTAREAVAA